MNDPLFVRGFERLRNLARKAQGLVNGKPLMASGSGALALARGWNRELGAIDHVLQRRPLDQFHHEERSDLTPHTNRTFFEPVEGRNVRMIERRQHQSFAREPLEPFSVGRERRRQDLQRDLALQLRVKRPIHATHSTLTDLRGDFVHAESGAGNEGHGFGRIIGWARHRR